VLAALFRITVLTPVLGTPLLIAKLVTVGGAGPVIVTDRAFDQLETMVV
jgi:hypothetical protein